jgi:hypothetical protein
MTGQDTPVMMMRPIGLRERRIEQCPTMWFNEDFIEHPWPNWRVDVDTKRPTTYFNYTSPGETIAGYPVRIELERLGVVWVATSNFCRIGGPTGQVLVEASWPE